jgi:tetratricopeptide (TPR) repeat protein
MLFDTGNVDEAIRQFNAVTQRDKNSATTYYLLAQAYRVKEQYALGIEAAQQAVKLTPKNGEAHFWLAECLRGEKRWQDAIAEYREYLKLTNFDSTAIGKFGYYAIGFKFFTKKRAGTQDVWKELRALAYFGLCDAERRVNHPDNAIAYCQKALSFDAADPLTHYALALAYMYQFNNNNDPGMLPAARKHFAQMITINPDLEEVKVARTNITTIDQFLKAQ